MTTPTLHDALAAAARDGRLRPDALKNIEDFLASRPPAWAATAVAELAGQGAWSELNDRFYRYLEFGTGGMRGRTVGAVAAAAETGTPGALGAPEHAAVGSNLLNDFTLIRAVIGLYRYTRQVLDGRGDEAQARLVLAYDVRYFSRHFGELAASTWSRLGGEAHLFDGPRPTPQLSYSVRWLHAHAGVVITASHNPPHDNGFKAYFGDGAQLVPPDDRGVVAAVGAVALDELGAFLTKDLTRVKALGAEADAAYQAVAAQAVLDPAVIRAARPRLVYTNIHGTGAVHALPLLERAGCDVAPVPEQLAFDPRFPTVRSPNPENAEALSRGIAAAERTGAEAVLATDPDDDRMGVAVRARDGSMVLLTGNQIGSLLADYRLTKYKELGWIPAAGSDRACLIKTFVTTGLQDAIGAAHGVKVINTLTGFKWIAAKLRAYEERLRSALGPGFNYDATPLPERAALLLRHSTFYVFGTEESYGYLPNDAVRDKDGNAACLMFAELCAWVKGRGITVPDYLDELYVRHGCHREDTINLYYEGASGQAKIQRILDTYRSQPPTAFGTVGVARFQDFGRETTRDADGVEIPRQDLYIVTLANGYRYAARGSGTEPKMKFYLFGREPVADAAALPRVKAELKAELDRLKALIEADARRRAEG
jgi:phosphoglucomutase